MIAGHGIRRGLCTHTTHNFVEELSARQFGLLIAYVLPGFLLLCGLSSVHPGVRLWLFGLDGNGPTGGSMAYVLLASIGVGMTASVVRWALVDTLHHHTGLARPDWNDARLGARLPAYQLLIEIHYRYYQFYANTLVAAVPAYAAWRPVAAPPVSSWACDAAFVLMFLVFLAGSRDALRRYYDRTERVLGRARRRSSHDQRRQTQHQTTRNESRHGSQAQADGHDQVGCRHNFRKGGREKGLALTIGTTTPDAV